MVGHLILRGLVCGLLAGFLAFGFARTFGEPLVERAVAFEAAEAAAKGEPAEAEVFSRATQAGLGLLTGTLAVGTACGGLFALVFALIYGRLGPLRARELSVLLAAAAFTVLVVVPMLKYPANPPSIGDPGTIGLRTALYFELIAVSVATAGLAVALSRVLSSAWGAFEANVAGVALFVAAMAVASWLMPTVDEVPDTFSADLLWRFRIVAVGLQAVLWATVGLGFGALAHRCLEVPGAAAMSRRLPVRRKGVSP